MNRTKLQSLLRTSYSLAALLLFAAAGCAISVSGGTSSLSHSGQTMGTTYSVKCWSAEAVTADLPVVSNIVEKLEQVNQQMSTYVPDSELSKFNESPANEWFAVSPETAYVVERAVHYYNATSGASDVTVGPLVQLWDFGPGHHHLGAKLEAPTDEELATAKQRSGCSQLEVRAEPPALRKQVDGLEVDLSSIAKGYAVDVIADLLSASGYENYMVEIGGEVRAAGTRQDGKPWRIGIEQPNLTNRQVHTIVELADQALATSGDYRNFREFDGERVSHIIDPTSGRPLPYRGWSVTLLTPTCLEADALATALLVMGEDRGYDWCEEHEIAALFLLAEDGVIVERATSKFPPRIPVHQ